MIFNCKWILLLFCLITLTKCQESEIDGKKEKPYARSSKKWLENKHDPKVLEVKYPPNRVDYPVDGTIAKDVGIFRVFLERRETGNPYASKALVLDERTIELHNFKLSNPDKIHFPKFYASSDARFTNIEHNIGGVGLNIADEKGSCEPLREYNDETIKLYLPKDYTWYNLHFIAIMSPNTSADNADNPPFIMGVLDIGDSTDGESNYRWKLPCHTDKKDIKSCGCNLDTEGENKDENKACPKWKNTCGDTPKNDPGTTKQPETPQVTNGQRSFLVLKEYKTFMLIFLFQMVLNKIKG